MSRAGEIRVDWPVGYATWPWRKTPNGKGWWLRENTGTVMFAWFPK